MEDKRKSQLSSKSAHRSQRQRASAMVHRATDTMTAVKDSFRHSLRELQGGPPPGDFIPYRKPSSGASSSPGDAMSPYSVVDCDVAKRATVRMVEVSERPATAKRTSKYPSRASRPGSRLSLKQLITPPTPTEPVPPLPAGFRKLRLLHPIVTDLSQDMASSLRLTSPILPARLKTPTTPVGWYASRFPIFWRPGSTTENAMPAAADLGLAGGGRREPETVVEDEPEEEEEEEEALPRIEMDDEMGGERRSSEFFSDLEVVAPLRIQRKPIGSAAQAMIPPAAETVDIHAPLVHKEPWHQAATTEAQILTVHRSWQADTPLIAVVCLANTLAAAAFAQGLVPAHSIGTALGQAAPGGRRLAWLTAGFALLAGVSALPAARLAAVLGGRAVFLSGLAWLALWSLLAGMAAVVHGLGGDGMAFLCFCRAMQGAATGVTVPTGHSLLLSRVCWSDARRAVVLTLFYLCTPIGFILGAVMASLFASVASWSWAFYSLATACTSLVVLSAFAVSRAPRAAITTAQQGDAASEPLWLRLDLPGSLLGMTALALFSTGWNQAAVVSFHTPYTYFLVIIGSLLFAAFAYLETRAPHPVLPVAALGTARARLALAYAAAEAAAAGVWLWYAARWMARVWGWPPLHQAAALAPLAISAATATLLAGYALAQKRDMAPWLALASAAATLVGCAILAAAPPAQTYWQSALFSVILVPFGAATAVPAALALLDETTTTTTTAATSSALPSLAFAAAMCALSVAVGMAGALERGVREAGGDVVCGIRAAQYLGLGVACLGVLVTGVLAFLLRFRR